MINEQELKKSIDDVRLCFGSVPVIDLAEQFLALEGFPEKIRIKNLHLSKRAVRDREIRNKAIKDCKLASLKAPSVSES